jgi:transcriptional regulator with XRE-family HTH domain
MHIKNLDVKVKALRAVTGLTVLEFCDEIGINYKSVWRWERGEPIDEQLARRMAAVFGYTFDQFLADSFPTNNAEALLCLQEKTAKRALRAAKAARS